VLLQWVVAVCCYSVVLQCGVAECCCSKKFMTSVLHMNALSHAHTEVSVLQRVVAVWCCSVAVSRSRPVSWMWVRHVTLILRSVCYSVCCCSVLLQCVVAVRCFSVVLQFVVAVWRWVQKFVTNVIHMSALWHTYGLRIVTHIWRKPKVHDNVNRLIWTHITFTHITFTYHFHTYHIIRIGICTHMYYICHELYTNVIRMSAVYEKQGGENP